MTSTIRLSCFSAGSSLGVRQHVAERLSGVAGVLVAEYRFKRATEFHQNAKTLQILNLSLI